ncbi:MAG: 2-hydroxyacid dehydrogenase [Clostridia bacterium]|nr:2-hydroxyacid dehydrogenase [Clostridia bacterium]
MKAVAVSDVYIKKDYYEECFASYPEYDLKVVDFGDGTRTGTRAVFHMIEKGGPESVPLPEELCREIEDADILMVHICPVPRSLLVRGKKLRAVLSNRGGVENIDVAAASELGIPVLNNPAHNANGVAELTVGLILAETRNIARSHFSMKNGVWNEVYPNTDRIFELRGKTVGIVGYGNIGRLVAEKLSSFGVRLLVNDIRYDPDEILEDRARYGIEAVPLPDLMRRSDVVTLHVRGTQTVLDASLLSLMKPTAFFINTARACLVDYGALYTLLKERRIAGAALEVHPTEPTPPGYPFASLDNVTLTTHRGGDTLNAYSDSPAMVMSDYARYLAGKKPRFFVDPEVGYGK